MRDRPNIKGIIALTTEPDADPALAARVHAIAARERAGGGAYQPIRVALAARYGAGDDASLLARLAAEIRSGGLDAPGEERRRVAGLLWRLTVQRLRESNPDFLDPSREEFFARK